MHCTIKLQNS